MKTMFRILSILICSAIFLAACAPAAPAQPKTPGATDVMPASGNKVTINVWGFEGEAEFFPKLIEAFQAENPNIEIKLTEIPEGDFVTKMDTAMLAGEGPDIAFMYVPKWLKAGNFLALDDAMKQYNVPVADLNKGALAPCQLEGKLYCVGTYTGAILMFYNKDMFDKVGVAYPSATDPMSIQEYTDMALKLSKKSDKIEERVWGGDAGVTTWWMDWRNLVGDDGRKVEGNFNDEATSKTFELIAQMRKDGSAMTDSDSATVQMEGTDLLAQGRLATTMIDNVIAIPVLEKAKINWGAAIVPTETKGDKPWTTTWSDTYGVLSTSKHPAEAMKFVAFMGTKGNEIRLEFGSLPLNDKMAEQWATSEPRKQALAVIKLARPNVFCPPYWESTNLIYDAWTSIVVDGVPVKEALAKVVPEMQKSLDQGWQTFDEISKK